MDAQGRNLFVGDQTTRSYDVSQTCHDRSRRRWSDGEVDGGRRAGRSRRWWGHGRRSSARGKSMAVLSLSIRRLRYVHTAVFTVPVLYPSRCGRCRRGRCRRGRCRRGWCMRQVRRVRRVQSLRVMAGSRGSGTHTRKRLMPTTMSTSGV